MKKLLNTLKLVLFIISATYSVEVEASTGFAVDNTIVYKDNKIYDCILRNEYFTYDSEDEYYYYSGEYKIEKLNTISGDLLDVLKRSNCTTYALVIEETSLFDKDRGCEIASTNPGDLYQVYDTLEWHYLVYLEEDIAYLPKSRVKLLYQFTTHKYQNLFQCRLNAAGSLNEYIYNFSLPQLNNNQELIDYACSFVGNPYVWGGTDPNIGADCSGFIQYVYNHFGYKLPRCSYEQVNSGREIYTEEDLQPGDLLFYWKNKYGRVGHVSMYIGNGECVEAKGAAYGIVKSKLNWDSVYKAKRILEE